MAVKFANNASSALASSISDTDTTVTLVDASAFPSLAAAEWFPLTVVNGSGDMEIMRVTARSGETLTVERGQEGTTAVAFSSGAKCDLRITSGALADLAPTGGGGGSAGVGQYVATIGNGTDTTFTITHNLGTKNVVVSYVVNNPVGGLNYGIPYSVDTDIFLANDDGFTRELYITEASASRDANSINISETVIYNPSLDTVEPLPSGSLTVIIIGGGVGSAEYEALKAEIETARGPQPSLNARIVEASRPSSPIAAGVVPGNYFDNSFHGAASTTLAGAANRVDMAPFITAEPLTIDQLGIAISTSVTSALVRCFIYGSDENGWPDELLYEGDTDLSAGSTGYTSHTLDFTFEAGRLYWVGVRSSSTATYRAIALTSALNLGLSSNNGQSYFTQIRRTLTFSTALPANWGFTGSDLVAGITPPSIRMRAA